MCNHCLSPQLWVRIPLMARCTRYNIVIKFVSDLRQVGGFRRVLRFPPPIKLIAAILWNTIPWYTHLTKTYPYKTMDKITKNKQHNNTQDSYGHEKHKSHKHQKIEQHIRPSELLLRKIIEIYNNYMMTSKQDCAYHTPRGAATLEEYALCPFTRFTRSTMIIQHRMHHWIMFIVHPR